MAEVYLDEEVVNFEGPPPQDVNAVWSLVEGFLGGAGKLIRSMTVDGNGWTPESGVEIGEFEKIEIRSWSQLENLIFCVEQFVLQKTEMLDSWDHAGRKVLSTSWTSYQTEAVESLESLKPLIQLAETLANVAQSQAFDWGGRFGELNNSLNTCLGKLIDTIGSKDSIRFSDLVAYEFRKVLIESYDMIERDALPSLRALVSDE
ncbi:hypothetical protein MLD52_04880 [Puniceicoccaceae bacterium K14]|nr:hypothetical protein [Puniceicoccaceae bacterium K14]